MSTTAHAQRQPACRTRSRLAREGLRFLGAEALLAVAAVGLAGLLLSPPVQGQDAVASRGTSAMKPLLTAPPDAKALALERLNQTVSMHLQAVTVEEALRHIATRAGLRLFYSGETLAGEQVVTLSLENATVLEALHEAIRGRPIKLQVTPSGHLIAAPDPTAAARGGAETEAEQPAGSIAGRVVDETGLGLPGVNVIVVETALGSTTGTDGRYTITGVPEGVHDVRASFIGYVPRVVEGIEVNTDETATADFTLEVDVEQMEEVVVVGYGTVRKQDLTGAVGTVDVEEAAKAPVTRIDQAIQGRVPGVHVTSVNGSPGARTTIRIRGGNSINAGNEPLYVVDGFVGADISSVNPNDIASIEVLKDASAVSIYGARGSNGVVLITTKKGRAGEQEVRFVAEYGMRTPLRRIDLLSAQQYMALANDGEAFLGNPPAFTEEEIQQAGERTNWQDEVIREAPMYNAQLSIRGGNEATQYYLAGSYLNQDGLLVGNTYDRAQLRLNLDHTAFSWLDVGTSFNYSRITNVPQNFGIGGLISWQPSVPVYLEDDTYSRFQDVNGNLFNNPLAQDEFIEQETHTNNLFNNSYVEVRLLPGLRLRSTLGLTLRDQRSNNFFSSQLPIRLEQGQQGEGSVFTSDQVNVLTENTLSYTPDLNENHRLDLLAGFTYQREETETTNSISDAVLNDLLSYYGIGLSNPENTRIAGGYDAWRLSSFIGRANYVLYDKYLFTLTARRDGASRFGPNNRYAFFPSVAVAWRLSQEPFIRDLDVFDNLKLRFSYGRSGNSNGIGSFARFQAMNNVFTSLGRGSREVGIINARLSNPDLKWETTDQYDVGLEFGFFRGRLAFEMDWYYKETNDLLFTKEVPRQTGFVDRLENIGSLKNTGVEFLVRATPIDQEDFSWDASFNISTYRNEITDLGTENNIVTRTHGVNVSGPSGMLIVGEPLGIFTGFQTDGIYQSEAEIEADGRTGRVNVGEWRYVDVNGDGAIDQEDITVVGNSNPDFFGGFQNTLRYRALELSTFFQFVYGNDVFNLAKLQITRVHQGNAYASFTDAWSESNPDGSLPRAQAFNAQASTSFAVEDGSFLRLKTLQLAYRLPTERLGWGSSGLRVYLSAHNLFQVVSSGYSNFDPETNSNGTSDVLRGYDNINYPSARTLSLGVDLTF